MTASFNAVGSRSQPVGFSSLIHAISSTCTKTTGMTKPSRSEKDDPDPVHPIKSSMSSSSSSNQTSGDPDNRQRLSAVP